MTVTQDTLLSLILVFCRIGGCFLLLPGISSDRIPMQFRLFFAIAISIAICPLVLGDLKTATVANADTFIPYVISETITGLLIGFFIRIFFLALEFGAIAAANFVGYGSVFSHAIENSESTTPLAMIVTLPATALFFVFDLHVRVIQLLAGSYAAFPPARPFDLDPTMNTVVETFGSAFRLALQVSAPLLVFSLTVNLLLGFLNKMVPQIPAYFISTPFLLLGGLFVFYFLIGAVLLNFEANVGSFIAEFLGRG